VFNNILVGAGSHTVVNCPGSFFEKDPPTLEFNDVITAGTGSRYGGVCSDLTGVDGNISADPLFFGASDFRLQLGSPAIDAGTSGGAPAIDIDGNARPRDGNADGVALWDMGAYELGPSDSVPPSITVPADITIAAEGPGGRPVSYNASAVDDVDGTVAVTCAPPSGSTFPIGTTSVTCTASDAAGNAASASFTVHVKGASEQVADLLALVDSYGLSKLGSSLQGKLATAQELLAARKPRRAEETLKAFIAQVKAQAGKGLSEEQADALTTSALRIIDVIET
jgi:HYR domain